MLLESVTLNVTPSNTPFSPARLPDDPAVRRLYYEESDVEGPLGRLSFRTIPVLYPGERNIPFEECVRRAKEQDAFMGQIHGRALIAALVQDPSFLNSTDPILLPGTVWRRNGQKTDPFVAAVVGKWPKGSPELSLWYVGCGINRNPDTGEDPQFLQLVA